MPAVRRRAGLGVSLRQRSFFLVLASIPALPSGTIGRLTIRGCDLQSEANKIDIESKLELLLEAARRANWDALHGPRERITEIWERLTDNEWE